MEFFFFFVSISSRIELFCILSYIIGYLLLSIWRSTRGIVEKFVDDTRIKHTWESVKFKYLINENLS